jgi:hypothetical protein
MSMTYNKTPIIIIIIGSIINILLIYISKKANRFTLMIMITSLVISLAVYLHGLSRVESFEDFICYSFEIELSGSKLIKMMLILLTFEDLIFKRVSQCFALIVLATCLPTIILSIISIWPYLYLLIPSFLITKLIISLTHSTSFDVNLNPNKIQDHIKIFRNTNCSIGTIEGEDGRVRNYNNEYTLGRLWVVFNDQDDRDSYWVTKHKPDVAIQINSMRDRGERSLTNIKWVMAHIFENNRRYIRYNLSLYIIVTSCVLFSIPGLKLYGVCYESNSYINNLSFDYENRKTLNDFIVDYLVIL